MIDHPQDTNRSEAARVFGEHRDLLVSVAYRVLGSVTDAEDAVQEAWIRWSGVDHTEVADPRAFLVRVTTRLAIDRLRRAKARRESYVGPWLPEPILTRQDPAEDAAMAESVSMAMLVVLETLSPLERAVFVLQGGVRDAPRRDRRRPRAQGRGGPPARQTSPRARPRAPNPLRRRSGRTAPGDRAIPRGDLGRRFRSADGCPLSGRDARGRRRRTGARSAPARPGVGEGSPVPAAIVGEEPTARFLNSVGLEPSGEMRVHLAQVNGETGVVITAGGEPISALVVDVSDGLVQTIRLVANPEKLAGIRGA